MHGAAAQVLQLVAQAHALLAPRGDAQQEGRPGGGGRRVGHRGEVRAPSLHFHFRIGPTRWPARGDPDLHTAPTPTLRLLGSAQVQRGAQWLHLPDALPGYLVAFLATRGDWVLRDELAALLWPNAGQTEAQNNLRVNLTRLRPHLARWGLDAGFVSERRRLRLDAASDVGALRAAHARGDWAAVAGGLHAPFLDGMSFRAFAVLGEWARVERTALHAVWRDALLRVAETMAPAQRLDLAQRVLAADPCDEEVLRLELGALAQLGRAAELPQRLADFDARVRAELGLGASPALADFVRRLASPAGDVGMPARAADADAALLGREAELAALADALDRPGLLTVVGLGGSGKTQLARAARAALGARFEASLWLPLAATAGAGEVAGQLADALQLTRSAGRDPLDQAVEHIGERPTLLVLDNAEHLLADAAALPGLLSRLLERCAQLHILATSREPLGHAREGVLRLGGLALPQPGRPPLEAAALQLFLREAQRVQPGFDARSAVEAMAEIARLTGGLPLALRIAAGWLRLLSCADVAAEIGRGLAALEPGPGEPPGLPTILAGSWARLASAERSALAQLSVFAGAFSAQAAAEVAQAGLPVLGRLAGCGLLETAVAAGAGGAGERTRFELHPLVRRFAADRLAEDWAGRRAVRQRHADHVRRALDRAAALRRSDPRRALLDIGALLPDLRLAWDATLDGSVAPAFVAEAAPRLCSHFEITGGWDEGLALFAAAESALDPEQRADLAALAAAATARARMLFRRGDSATAEPVAQRGLAWAREVGPNDRVLDGLATLGMIWLRGGRFEQALASYGEARALALADGATSRAAAMAGSMALAHAHLGQPAQAEAMWRERLAAERDAGNALAVAQTLHNLGSLMIDHGRSGEAVGLFEEALRLCDQHGFASTRAPVLNGLARAHRDEGRQAAAVAIAELALAESRRVGEQKMRISAHITLAELKLTDPDPDADPARGLPDAREALWLAHVGGDRTNLYGALDVHALWLTRIGDAPRAALVWAVVLGQPDLSDSIRGPIETNRQRAALPADLAASALAAAAQTDVTALVERALAEYDRHIG
jgi:predicted ATPase/DNA-binding SARP family transcriptional activator